MKTILKRKDKTSIFCPRVRQRSSRFTVKTKVIEITVACALIIAGFFIMTVVH